jgi:hypothetical protein
MAPTSSTVVKEVFNKVGTWSVRGEFRDEPESAQINDGTWGKDRAGHQSQSKAKFVSNFDLLWPWRDTHGTVDAVA